MVVIRGVTGGTNVPGARSTRGTSGGFRVSGGAEESREAVNRVDRVALGVRKLERHRVVGAEDEYAGVDKVEHGRHSGRVSPSGPAVSP